MKCLEPDSKLVLALIVTEVGVIVSYPHFTCEETDFSEVT